MKKYTNNYNSYKKRNSNTTCKTSCIKKENYNKIGVVIFVLSLVLSAALVFYISLSSTKQKETQETQETTQEETQKEQENKLNSYVELIKNMNEQEVSENGEKIRKELVSMPNFKRKEAEMILIHLKYRYNILCLEKDNSNRKCRSELHSLENNIISVPLTIYNDKYKNPEDLFYGFFLNDQDIGVSQEPWQHMSPAGGKMLARDISTSGKSKILYAPDMYNNEVVWNIEAKDSLPGTGMTIILTSEDKKYKILVGHIKEWNGVTKAKTGDIIGVSGGTKGDPTQGLTTGEHIHVEHYIYDRYKDDFVSFLYDFNNSESHIYKKEIEKNTNQELKPKQEVKPASEKNIKQEVKQASISRYVKTGKNDPWYFRDTEGKWKGAQGFFPQTDEERELAYNKDFYINCQGSCDYGAAGVFMNPGHMAACDPKYKFGTKFIIQGKTFTCTDRGGAIKDHKRGGNVAIDIMIPKEEWKSYEKFSGVQDVTIIYP